MAHVPQSAEIYPTADRLRRPCNERVLPSRAERAGRNVRVVELLHGAHRHKLAAEVGTFFRCIAFTADHIGLAGNIGPGYFPNVTDTTPLYRTEDGGATWTPVTKIDGPPVVGLCAIEVLREKFVNAGNLDKRVRVYAAARVGEPSAQIFSDDLGKTWSSIDLAAAGAAMVFDVHFFDRDHGVLAAASDADIAVSNALILTTADGRKTWAPHQLRQRRQQSAAAPHRRGHARSLDRRGRREELCAQVIGPGPRPAASTPAQAASASRHSSVPATPSRVT